MRALRRQHAPLAERPAGAERNTVLLPQLSRKGGKAVGWPYPGFASSKRLETRMKWGFQTKGREFLDPRMAASPATRMA
jgi:hypothetical protein